MRRFLAYCFILATLNSIAQDGQLSMKQAVLGRFGSLAPERLEQLQWLPGTDQYSYLKEKDGEKSLYIGLATEGKANAQAVLTFEDLNGKVKALKNHKLRRFPRMHWENSSEFSFELKRNVFVYNIQSKQLRHTDSLELLQGARNRDKAPAGGYIAFTVENNLYVLKDDKSVAITKENNPAIVSGQSVSRQEFGISKGTFWSPDGTKLAFYVKDESAVTDYPIVNWKAKPAEVEMIKYPLAGAEGTELVYLKVYDLNSGKVVTLKTGEPQTQYLTNITWSPDSREIYIAHLNRDQDHMELKSYNPENGKLIRTLFEEKSDHYVEPMNPAHFVTGRNDRFIWESQRSGHNHLYLYNTNGKFIDQLTDGDWDVTSFKGFNVNGQKAFFTSTATSPLNRDLYSVNLKDLEVERLTTGNGTHSTTLNGSGQFFIDNFSNTTTASKSSIKGIVTDVKFELLNSPDPLKDFDLGQLRMPVLKSSNGDDLYCRMILPPDFDSTKKYPVVVYVYGGPHVQLVRNSWLAGGNLWFQYMAQRGYIVWTMDSRGSGNRGAQWEQNIHRELGKVEMEDQMVGVDFLKSKSYVDSNRMGVHGWSFGGFMTMSLMSKYPGVFKAGVAGGPVIDWNYYEIMYTERYMDSPQQNPEGYANNSLLSSVEDLEGKLMIIHGTSDPVVLWQHTQLYLMQAVKKKKQVDYFVYPMHEHNVRGKDRIHLMQKVTDYFEDFL